jgi:hypothetical protein
MPHLQVLVDGEIRYEGEVAEQYLPSQPSMFPKALGAAGGPNTSPTPLAKLMMLTALIELVRKALESPMLQPLNVDIETRGMGCATITIDTPQPPSRGPIAL